MLSRSDSLADSSTLLSDRLHVSEVYQRAQRRVAAEREMPSFPGSLTGASTKKSSETAAEVAGQDSGICARSRKHCAGGVVLVRLMRECIDLTSALRAEETRLRSSWRNGPLQPRRTAASQRTAASAEEIQTNWRWSRRTSQKSLGRTDVLHLRPLIGFTQTAVISHETAH
jgi:hypothetical protein